MISSGKKPITKRFDHNNSNVSIYWYSLKKLFQFKKELNNKLKPGELGPNSKQLLEKLFDELDKKVRENKTYAAYFDREYEHLRMCDERGMFKCEGPKGEGCTYRHTINPYESNDAVERFSLWEFDHM